MLGPMDASLNWLNRYLEPAVSADEAERWLTQAGFPIEERRELPSGDVFLDVEVTSNRGDCLCHVGLAREVAACAGIAFRPPEFVQVGAGEAASDFDLSNTVADKGCPRFTAQVIKGVKVGPSPKWMVDCLEAVGQRSINNLVDVTNWLNFELGQPAHVFDLAKLAGGKLEIRHARSGETITTLDGKTHKLAEGELVIVDAARVQSLAGIMGGLESEVSQTTVDVVLEAATWDPIAIRRASRRLNIRTDAQHRFERGVDARTVDAAARRAAALIIELAGGRVLGGGDEGLVVEGGALPETTFVDLRPARCSKLLGVDLATDEIVNVLQSHEISVDRKGEDLLRCAIPAFRLDLTREIDLIEEVARTIGFDRIPVGDRLPIVVPHPQESERALRQIGSVLTGLGFYETVTFSFISPKVAEPFVRPELATVAVDDDRRKAEPTLRPSVLPSLLACRKANQDARNQSVGGMRLFELAATYAQSGGRSEESRKLALLLDIPGVSPGKKPKHDQIQVAVRLMRGAVEAVVRNIGGPSVAVDVVPAQPSSRCWHTSGFAAMSIGGHEVGELGLVADSVLEHHDLDVPVVACEVELDALTSLRAARTRVQPLPAYPPIDRDLSIIVGEEVTWASVSKVIEGAAPERLAGVSFVGTYRGKPIPDGSKSVTVRLSFRDPERTLVHDEVDPEVEAVVKALSDTVRATLRA